jgi:hypothetical protein
MTGQGLYREVTAVSPCLPAKPRWSPLHLAWIWHGRWLVGSTHSTPVPHCPGDPHYSDPDLEPSWSEAHRRILFLIESLGTL